MTHDYNTRKTKGDSFTNALESLEKSFSEKLDANFTSLKDEILLLKDVVIKNLQEETGLLKTR